MFYYVFLVLVLLLPLRNIVLQVPALFGVPGFSLTNILYLLIFIGIILAGRSGSKVNYCSKVTLPLILFVVYFFIQIFIQPGLHSYSELLIWWKDSFLFLLLTYLFVTRTIHEPKKIFLILVVMCIASIYMDTYFWRWVRWMSFDNFADKMKSVNGTFGDVGGCNEWAAFFSTYTLVIIATMNSLKKKWLGFCLKILAAAHVLVLMFTFSRGSYVGFFAGLIYLFVAKKKYIMIAFLLCLPVFYTVLLPHAVTERVQMSFETNDFGETADQDVESRLVMWKQSMVMFSDSPIIGHGLLSFRYYHWRNPHNQHLNILVQGGIIGYGLFVWLFIGAFRDANYLARSGKDQFARSMGQGMCAAIISLFLANIFGDRWSYYVITGYFWVLLGIIYTLTNRDTQAVQKESEILFAEK